MLQLLPSSCISSFHSEPLCESPFALTEGQEDLQSAWPGFVSGEGHFSPVSVSVLWRRVRKGLCHIRVGGLELVVCLSEPTRDKAVGNLDSA